MGKRETFGGAERVLAVDVGNTHTALGLFAHGELASTWQLTTPQSLTYDEAFAAACQSMAFMARKANGLGAGEPQDAVLSCVVPSHTEAWQSALRQLTGRRPLTIGPGVKTGIKMKYKDPAEVGADRIADLAAVLRDYEPPVVVIDMGTTTNFEVVDAQGVFLGGIIAPGLAQGARSLAREAARLPVIEVRPPKSVIGTTTREAMQSGVVLGEIARIEGLLSMIDAQAGAGHTVVVTGSDAQAIADALPHAAHADETLTLRGLGYLHALNRG